MTLGAILLALFLAGSPQPAESDLDRGLALFKSERYEEAIAPLRRAQQDRPDDPQLLIALGASLARTGQTREAQQVFEHLIRTQPETAGLHLFWGEGYQSLHDGDKAAAEFRRALELDPNIATAHDHLGVLALGKHDFATAEAEFRAELSAHPEDTRA